MCLNNASDSSCSLLGRPRHTPLCRGFFLAPLRRRKTNLYDPSDNWRGSTKTVYNPRRLKSAGGHVITATGSIPRRGTRPRGFNRLWLLPWHRNAGSHVPYKSLVELRAAYTPDAARAVSRHPPSFSRRKGHPRFRHRLIRFRRFCSGSLALASLDRACRNQVPTFPQRSPPRLLTAAACGGLGSAPDRRTRRALLHLSYSCASPGLLTMLVTHDPTRTPRSSHVAFAKPV